MTRRQASAQGVELVPGQPVLLNIATISSSRWAGNDKDRPRFDIDFIEASVEARDSPWARTICE
jgi:hypothetical protein